MTSFTQLIADMRETESEGIIATIPPTWMQGRTTYGGLTAALCFEAARSLVDDLPLRSVQVGFVGPSGGEVSLHPKLLRRGKNTAFVSVDMVQPEGFAAQCIFAFGAPRESSVQFQSLPMPDIDGPDLEKAYFRGGAGPNFTQNFDMQWVCGDAPISGSDRGEIGLWMRHRDLAPTTGIASVLAIADAPPPAVMPMMKTPGPISSMTWMAEVLSEDISTEDGWFFALHKADTALNGYSSQSMTLWNRMGEPVLIGRQTIAVFS